MSLPLLFVILVSYLSWFPFSRNPLYQDQSLHLTIARNWRKGKIPYKDFQLSMPPHLLLIYLLGDFVSQGQERFFMFFSATYVVAGNVFLYLTADRLFGTVPAVIAGMFYAFYMFSPRLVGDRFPPESYVTTPTVMAFYFLTAAPPGHLALYIFLSSLSLGFASLIRQTVYFYLPVFLAGAVYQYSLFQGMLFLLGVAGLHLAWWVYFFRRGIFSEYFRTTHYNIFSLVFLGNSVGKRGEKRDMMRVTGDRKINLIVNNSFTIFPLYLCSLSYFLFRSSHHLTPPVVLLMGLFITGFLLLTPRRNFDSCYWLNTVPWASLAAGASIGLLYKTFTLPLTIEDDLLLCLASGYAAYIFFMDYRYYTQRNPQERDRLYDPRKISHASWWPTFQQIGEYIWKNTPESATVMVLGHAARIYNSSGRIPFFKEICFVPHRHFKYRTATYDDFRNQLKKDYPDVIVLAGHMPAFPFHPQPYLEDMKRIEHESGIIYQKVKVFDRFPIYVADREKSYIKALLQGRFLNNRLKTEKEKISAPTL